MDGLLLSVLPLALGAAVSPTLLALELLILSGGNHPLSRAWWFTAGAFVVLLAYALLGLAFLHQLPDAGTGSPSPWSVAIKIGAGLALVYLGIRQLRRRPKTDDPEEPGPLQKKVAGAGPLVFAGVGALGMLTNASTLVLLFPAMHTISLSTDPPGDKIAVTAIVLLITMSLILLPVLSVTLLGRRADPVLATMNNFTVRHKRQINAGIAFFFAAWLLWSGTSALLALR